MKRVLVTGATGFIGRSLCRRLLADNKSVRGTVTATVEPATLVAGVEPAVTGLLGPDTEWQSALDGVDAVCHLAARVHVMADKTADPLAEYRLTNVVATDRLAREAAKSGVKRFIFISSVKVNGEESDTPYTEASPPQPVDPYGFSKLEAEQLLRRIEAETGMEVVIIRPPLVYGPGVKANFLALLKLVNMGIPLPFAGITNKRSLVYVENLVDAITACLAHPSAAGRTYLVSDGKDMSTTELIRQLGSSIGKQAVLFALPHRLMRFCGTVAGRSAAVARLLGSLQVDSSRIRSDINWKPPFTVQQGLQRTADWFVGGVAS